MVLSKLVVDELALVLLTKDYYQKTVLTSHCQMIERHLVTNAENVDIERRLAINADSKCNSTGSDIAITTYRDFGIQENSALPNVTLTLTLTIILTLTLI